MSDLERLLDRTALRLALRARLARAAWLGLASVVAVELGALAARGVGPGALLAGALAGAAGGVAALVAFVAGSRPSRVEAARVLDATLGRGALLETAAEALAGKHGAFGRVAIDEAAGVPAATAARAVPIEAPRGLWLMGGAALLLLALTLGPASPETAATGEPTVVWDESGPGAGPRATPSPGSSPVIALHPTDAGAPSPGALPPEVARALEAKLREIASRLAARPSSTGSEGAEKAALKTLEDALARGDEAAARKALEALEARGTRESSPALEKAAHELVRGGSGDGRDGTGSGAGEGGPVKPSPGASSPPGPTPAAAGGTAGATEAREAVRWRVRAAEQRYRQALEETRGS